MAKVLQQSDGVISFDISVDGGKIKDTAEVLEIYTQVEVNRIASATIFIKDGGAIGVDNAEFTNSESTDFIPGNKIKISMGHDNIREDVFEGIIVSHGLMVKNGISQLIVTCKDKAVKMTKGRFNALYENKKDSDIISTIVGKYDLQKDIASTDKEYPQVMQYNCSNWDFVVIRAEMNNMAVLTDKGKLVVKKYDFSQQPSYEIIASQYIIDIDLSLESEDIAASYKNTAWDDESQESTDVSVKLSDSLKQGNLTASKLSEVINADSNHFSSTSLNKDELTTWAESCANKAVLSKIQGKIRVPGTAKIIAGDLVKLSDFSARFNGNAYVSKVEHLMQDGSWTTTLYVGKSVQWHAALPDVEETLASGLLPAANGTQIATVQKINEDPDGNYRVLVTLPAFTGDGQEVGLWARLAFPYASADAGFFFFPEVGDEVLLTFINNDPRYPVITGSLYNKKNKPKETADEENQFKSIYSKSGIYIKFDDVDKILTIETPDGNSFVLSDKDKSISIKDMNENSLVMDDSGITMDSPKDINITAKGSINISAKSGLNLEATEDVKADGMNVELTAKTGFTAKGNATAEISASGQTTVKGAMVMIN